MLTLPSPQDLLACSFSIACRRDGRGMCSVEAVVRVAGQV